MKVALQGLAIGGSLILATMMAGAQAAPIARATEAMLAGSSPVATVASRHCWRRHGKLHCSGYGVQRRVYRSNGGTYYEHDSDALPFGSQRWWEQMQRENRFGGGGGGKD